MEENGSRVSETCEGGGSNDSIPNTEGLSPDSPDEAPKKRKVMQPRSNAWKHFEKYDDPSGAKKAKCNYCQKTYAAATKGTSSASSGNTTTTVSGYGSFLKRGTMRTKLEFEKHKEVTGGLGTKSELERYLAEDLEPETDDFKILKWWKINEPRFPILAEMARDVLAIPISSVASECAFSTGGRILDSFRSSLTPKLVQSLICLQDWLRSEPIPIKVEEDLEYLEQLELDLADSAKDSTIIDI
ncbi:zinc finger BED domain-containing protein RICESLEEPER 2-like [Nicotiana sylvestris]|uniref:zinc finger BED domain-containing protein RICESLEEPER 2-like n=1 Tax=Nicotiana sylvestris TaxID=4096 RepID=UPI00388CC466